jgi:endogenous inhibitor of DNA gyrase (YacG/DUF329 family)
MINIGSFLFLGGITLLAGLLVSSPWFNQKTIEKNLCNLNEDRREQLAEIKLLIEAEMEALNELDVDRIMNHMMVNDFTSRREKMVDQLNKFHAEKQRIEAIMRYTSDQTGADEKCLENRQSNEMDLENLIAAYRHARSERAVGLCPICGKAFLRSDSYCGKCGTSLQTDILR